MNNGWLGVDAVPVTWLFGAHRPVGLGTRVPPVVPVSAGGCRAPRVWSGRGLAMAEADLPALDKVLGEVLKLPVYRPARARRRRAAPGVRPAPLFHIDLVHLRVLRISIAAYRAASTGRG
ncbi:hypothetical protein [Amycolatopsis sp. cmx-4-68]|uniref:hypothetical protein n=1 Tax=Amycolatopsis sp. cmx-4-68 TaxID=2790938 RepID=UPI00397C580B